MAWLALERGSRQISPQRPTPTAVAGRRTGRGRVGTLSGMRSRLQARVLRPIGVYHRQAAGVLWKVRLPVRLGSSRSALDQWTARWDHSEDGRPASRPSSIGRHQADYPAADVLDEWPKATP